MGKVEQFLPIWMASAAQTTVVTAGLIASKIHLIPIVEGFELAPNQDTFMRNDRGKNHFLLSRCK
jgi:hypothetical protein